MKRKPSLPALKRKCWKLVSEFVRRKHADQNGMTRCYTCGASLQWKYGAQAGHAIPGRTGAVLFDVDILRPQCIRCNFFMRGRYEIFSAKLIKENGLEWWEKKLSDSRQLKKYTRSDLEDLIAQYKTKLEVLG